MATVLALVQAFARRNGLEVPSALFASTDPTNMQFREILEDVGMQAQRSCDWHKLLIRTTWTSTGVESQGLIDFLLYNNLDYIVPKTFWDNTTRQPIFGPLSPMAWQQIKAMVPSTPLYQYTVMEGNLLVAGPIPNTHTLSLIYKTRSWLETAVGAGATLTAITADTNVPIFPDNVMELGLAAFWRKTKELPYQQEMEAFSRALMTLAGNDSVKPVIDMAGGKPQIKPGIWVPAGNWPV